MLCKFVQRWDPNIVFLMETKLKKKRMEKEKEKASFNNGLVIPSSSRSGGLALLWKKDIVVEVQGYSGNYIDAIVTDPTTGFKWQITGFYGHPETHRRKESWNLLRDLNRRYKMPWMCFGDFNEIVSMEEKKGGAVRSQRQMEDFRNAIHQCGFRDLGYCGPNYTWCNMQEGDDRIYLRLDRALATADWIEHYRETRVHHLVDSTSDHCALLITDSMT